MVSNGRKAGISMVALVITIIVLIVLTSAVVITGVGAPKQAQLAVFKSNIATIQELVGIQMSENMITGALESKGNNYKWQGIVQGYDYDTEHGASPNFAVESGKCNAQPVANISTQLLSKTTLNSNEYDKYYISVDGVVYHEGMTINGTTYYNENAVQTSGIYGIKRALDTSDTTWERTDDSIGKNANATLYGVLTGTNDFDNIYPWSAIRSYNYDVASDTITAWYGDSNYRADGSNGDVLTYIPEFWYKRVQENGYEYIQISATQVDSEYIKSEAFSIARYETYIEDGKSYSKSGAIPTIWTSLTDFRTYAQATSDKYCLMDYRYFTLQLLYLVEYADYDAKLVLGEGYTDIRWKETDRATIAEPTATNRIIVENEVADFFVVGQQISISHVGTTWYWLNVARDRTITKIEEYDSSNKAIYFDGDAVNIQVGDNVHSSPQKSGSCDSLGMKSGTARAEQKSGVIYRGVENICGNVLTFLDGARVNNYELYLSTNPEDYTSEDSTVYTETHTWIGTLPNSAGHISTIGYNASNPLVMYPTAVEGTQNTYTTDYYFVKENQLLDRVLYVGGAWYHASNNSGGLWHWRISCSPTNVDVSIGARLLKYQ